MESRGGAVPLDIGVVMILVVLLLAVGLALLPSGGDTREATELHEGSSKSISRFATGMIGIELPLEFHGRLAEVRGFLKEQGIPTSASSSIGRIQIGIRAFQIERAEQLLAADSRYSELIPPDRPLAIVARDSDDIDQLRDLLKNHGVAWDAVPMVQGGYLIYVYAKDHMRSQELLTEDPMLRRLVFRESHVARLRVDDPAIDTCLSVLVDRRAWYRIAFERNWVHVYVKKEEHAALARELRSRCESEGRRPR